MFNKNCISFSQFRCEAVPVVGMQKLKSDTKVTMSTNVYESLFRGVRSF